MSEIDFSRVVYGIIIIGIIYLLYNHSEAILSVLGIRTILDNTDDNKLKEAFINSRIPETEGFNNIKVHPNSKSGLHKGNEVEKVLTIYKVNWCPHCKRLTPIIDKLKDKMNSEPIPGSLLEVVDCEKDPHSCQKAGVESYPTIVVWKKGALQPIRLPDSVNRENVEELYQYLARI